MARKGDIEIPIAVDTGGVAKQINNGLVEPLEDAHDALEKLGKTDAGRDIDKAMDKAQDATEDLSKELDDARDDLKKLGYAGRDAGDDTKKGMGRAKDGVEEVGREAESTAKEAAASFDGSAESIGDAFQEVAANAFAGFGPAGVIAGVAVAAGIGIATEAIAGANEQTELAKERVAEWAGAFIEAGGTMVTAGIQAARIQEILTDPEKFAEAEKNAKNWGTTVETAISAMSGNAGAIEDVSTALDAQKTAAQEAATAAQKLAQENGGQLLNLTAAEQAYNDGAGALARLTGEMDAGAARAKILSDANVALINSASSATKEVDELGNAVYTLPDGTQIMVDAETGMATQNVSAFKGDLDGIPEEVTTRVKVTTDTSQAYRDLQAFQNKAAQGVRVPVGLGRTWE